MPKLAWLELALAEAFVGPDAEPLSQADAHNIDWDEAVLHFAPTFDLRAVATNVADLWAALASGETPPSAAMLPEQGALIIWRQRQISRFRLVDANEQQAVLLARSGMRFADICAAIVAQHGESAGIEMAGAYLGGWLVAEMLVLPR